MNEDLLQDAISNIEEVTGESIEDMGYTEDDIEDMLMEGVDPLADPNEEANKIWEQR